MSTYRPFQEQRTELAASLTVREVQRLMATLPADRAEKIWRHRCEAAYGVARESCRPSVDNDYQSHSALLVALAKCVPESRYAERFLQLGSDILKLGGAAHYGPTGVLAGMGAEVVLHCWRMEPRLASIASAELGYARNHPRRQRLIEASRIPIWVLETIVDLGGSELPTPENLVAIAVAKGPGNGQREECLLAEARRAYILLAVLKQLGVEPNTWNRALADLLLFEAVEVPDAWPAADRCVAPRTTRPPGRMLVSRPRVPRAPGVSAPRRIRGVGRQLHQSGGRGGRLTA